MNVEELRSLVLKPGDKLLFAIPENVSPDEVQDLQRQVQAIWPDVPMMVVAGDIDVSVVRTTEAEGEP